jgi:hypothetical protein
VCLLTATINQSNLRKIYGSPEINAATSYGAAQRTELCRSRNRNTKDPCPVGRAPTQVWRGGFGIGWRDVLGSLKAPERGDGIMRLEEQEHAETSCPPPGRTCWQTLP